MKVWLPNLGSSDFSEKLFVREGFGRAKLARPKPRHLPLTTAPPLTWIFEMEEL
jgi:hypothetical protein